MTNVKRDFMSSGGTGALPLTVVQLTKNVEQWVPKNGPQYVRIPNYDNTTTGELYQRNIISLACLDTLNSKTRRWSKEVGNMNTIAKQEAIKDALERFSAPLLIIDEEASTLVADSRVLEKEVELMLLNSTHFDVALFGGQSDPVRGSATTPGKGLPPNEMRGSVPPDEMRGSVPVGLPRFLPREGWHFGSFDTVPAHQDKACSPPAIFFTENGREIMLQYLRKPQEIEFDALASILASTGHLRLLVQLENPTFRRSITVTGTPVTCDDLNTLLDASTIFALISVAGLLIGVLLFTEGTQET